ncbi:MAG TPA: hypothetical protein VJH22_03270 [Candidatus Nanoarchaeia archaeon]|nr:hypothetical protein [Candidatus Nanoarchaeia archaeon]
MAKPVSNKLCEGCRHFEVFGSKCFFFWERKKECSNHTKGEFGIPIFRKVEFSE